MNNKLFKRRAVLGISRGSIQLCAERKWRTMKIIAISAVTGGGKTTVVNEACFLLKRAAALYFDAYSFDGEVEDFPKWQAEGADVNVWDLSPMKAEIDQLLQSGKYDYLLLDYPFAYQHKMLRDYLDCCIFIDTPLDIALARRVIRDMGNFSTREILIEMKAYLTSARPLFLQMQSEHLSSCDYIIDGSKPLEEIVGEVVEIIQQF